MGICLSDNDCTSGSECDSEGRCRGPWIRVLGQAVTSGVFPTNHNFDYDNGDPWLFLKGVYFDKYK